MGDDLHLTEESGRWSWSYELSGACGRKAVKHRSRRTFATQKAARADAESHIRRSIEKQLPNLTASIKIEL